MAYLLFSLKNVIIWQYLGVSMKNLKLKKRFLEKDSFRLSKKKFNFLKVRKNIFIPVKINIERYILKGYSIYKKRNSKNKINKSQTFSELRDIEKNYHKTSLLSDSYIKKEGNIETVEILFK